MSISRVLCKAQFLPNANPSHLHPIRCNRILQFVKSPDSTSVCLALAELRRGEAGIVSGLNDVMGLDDGRGAGATLLARLRDLGFVPGARCEIVARMWPAGDPMVVRVGGSTFALRRTEAAAVRVTRAGKETAARVPLAPKDTSAALA